MLTETKKGLTWKVTNADTGSSIESNDLPFLLSKVESKFNVDLPDTLGFDIIFNGSMDIQVKDKEGSTLKLEIVERVIHKTSDMLFNKGRLIKI